MPSVWPSSGRGSALRGPKWSAPACCRGTGCACATSAALALAGPMPDDTTPCRFRATLPTHRGRGGSPAGCARRDPRTRHDRGRDVDRRRRRSRASLPAATRRRRLPRAGGVPSGYNGRGAAEEGTRLVRDMLFTPPTLHPLRRRALLRRLERNQDLGEGRCRGLARGQAHRHPVAAAWNQLRAATPSAESATSSLVALNDVGDSAALGTGSRCSAVPRPGLWRLAPASWDA